jgi:hypothetical protein
MVGMDKRSKTIENVLCVRLKKKIIDWCEILWFRVLAPSVTLMEGQTCWWSSIHDSMTTT